MSEHTLGPLAAFLFDESQWVVKVGVKGTCGEPVAVFTGPRREADAKLFTKAWLLPEMVEALRECLEDLRGEYEGRWFCRGCGEWDTQHSPDCRYLQFHALLRRYEGTS